MLVEEELAGLSLNKDTLLTIGVFDGVHLGHKYLISQLKEQARQQNLLSSVITFRQHPQEVLSPQNKLPFLTDLSQRVDLLKNEGIEAIITLSFTHELAQLSARQFLSLLKKYTRMRGLVIGYDFAIGRNREGNTNTLRELGQVMNFSVTEIPPLAIDGEVVSSTAIRKALADGDMRKVQDLIGRLFSLHGRVITGAGRGMELGFPTANLDIDPEQALPTEGVYATWCYIGDKAYQSVTNIGKRPTFGAGEPTVEVYLLDYYSNLYERELKIDIVERLRGEKKFDTVEELKKQITRDVEQGRAILRTKLETSMDNDEKAIVSQDINHLLKRGVAEIIVEQEMIELLRSGKQLRLKEGFDPSFPDIHLGHMVTLRKLRKFQELGHQVILIVGDWTAQIGDPSGVSTTRPMLSIEQVQANAETYMKQFFKVVDRERTEVRWQSEWYGKFTLADVIQLTSKFTIAQLMAREDFSNRYNAGRPIAITELLYPLLQAYDSVATRADVEFGGTDQKFNLLVGRELQSMVGQPPQQIFLVPILVGTDGSQKMSKSLGNYIGVAESPNEIYGKVMSIPDSLILHYFELVTDVPDQELEEFRRELSDKTINPMTLKKRLAKEIVTHLYDQKTATEADEQFTRVFQKRELPEDIPQVEITKELLQKIKARSFKEGKFVVEMREVGAPEPEWYLVSVPLLLSEIGLAKSHSDAKRLIEQGSVDIDNKTISETDSNIKTGSIIKVGKRRFRRIVIDKEG